MASDICRDISLGAAAQSQAPEVLISVTTDGIAGLAKLFSHVHTRPNFNFIVCKIFLPN